MIPVSILMPVHNAEAYVGEAIGSVLAQTYRDFELLVINDASTDGSEAVVRGFDDPRLRYFRNEENLFQAGTRDRGVGLARGVWIALMDADDICEPDRLERQMRFLESNPAIGVLGSEAEVVDARGASSVPKKLFGVPASHAGVWWQMPFRCPLCHPTTIIRRDHLLRAGGYGGPLLRGRERYSAEDYDLVRRLLAVARFANLPEPLLRYRVHGGNVSGTGNKYGEHTRNCLMVKQACLMDRLGEAADENTLRCFWERDASGADRRRVAGLVVKLCDAAFRDGTLEPADRAEVVALAAAHLRPLLGDRGFVDVLAGESAAATGPRPGLAALMAGAREGPRSALPKIFSGAKPSSLLQVGCGAGLWLQAAAEFGISDVMGLDQADIPAAELLFPPERFRRQDPARPWDLGRRFAAALCLGVAGHLDEAGAGTLLDSLVQHADTIVFSAASFPHDGPSRLNRQEPAYWQKLFHQRGYSCEDDVRWKIWDVKAIEPFCRQNIFLARRAPGSAPLGPALPTVIHPEALEAMRATLSAETHAAHVEQIVAGRMSIGWYLALPFRALGAKFRRKLK